MNRPVPTGIAVLGALNLLLGASMALNAGWRVLTQLLFWGWRREAFFRAESASWLTLEVIWLLCLPLGLLLVLGGIGLLRRRWWGRTLSLSWAGLLVGTTAAYGTALAQGMAETAAMGSPAQPFLPVLLDLVELLLYPALLAVCLNLPTWRAPFSRRAPPSEPTAPREAPVARRRLGIALLAVGFGSGLGPDLLQFLDLSSARLDLLPALTGRLFPAVLLLAAGGALLTGARWPRSKR